jgi:hypothetical protein
MGISGGWAWNRSGTGVASTHTVKRCAILFVGPSRGGPHASELRALGFTVTEGEVLPDDAELLQYPVVVLASTSLANLPIAAARLRAKAGFGRRVVVARIDQAAPPAAVRSLLLCGVDETFAEQTSSRRLAARIIHRLRERPELRCVHPDVSQTPAA